MNISVKSEYALKAVFDLASQYLGCSTGSGPHASGQDRRHRETSKNPAKVFGTDPGRIEAERIRGFAARRRRRLSAGPLARRDHRRRSAAGCRKRERAPRAARTIRFRISGIASIRPFPTFSTRQLSPNWRASGRKSTLSTFPIGKSERQDVDLPRQFIQHRPHSARQTESRRRWRKGHGSGEDRRAQSVLFRQVPHRRVHGLGRRRARRVEAGHGDRRGDQREYRNRAGLRRRGARLSGHSDDARHDEHWSAARC